MTASGTAASGEHSQSLHPDTPLSVDVGGDDRETNGASHLRILARDTLMERMAGLVTNCRQSTSSPLPSPSNCPPANTTNPASLRIDSTSGIPHSTLSQDDVMPPVTEDSTSYRKQSVEETDYVPDKRIPQVSWGHSQHDSLYIVTYS